MRPSPFHGRAAAFLQIDGLRGSHQLEGDQAPPQLDHLGAFGDDQRRLRGVVLDAFRDRQEVEHHRVGLVADRGEDRGDRLLQRHEAGRGAADRRQIFRQAVAAGAGQLDEAGGTRRGRLRDGEAERLEGERQAGRVEIAGRHDGIVVGQHQRIVGGAVELDLDGAAGLIDRREQRAMDRRHAADRQRVLQGGRRGRVAAGEQVAQLPRRLLLPGGGPRGLQARIEDACDWRRSLPSSARRPAAAGRMPPARRPRPARRGRRRRRKR